MKAGLGFSLVSRGYITQVALLKNMLPTRQYIQTNLLGVNLGC